MADLLKQRGKLPAALFTRLVLLYTRIRARAVLRGEDREIGLHADPPSRAALATLLLEKAGRFTRATGDPAADRFVAAALRELGLEGSPPPKGEEAAAEGALSGGGGGGAASPPRVGTGGNGGGGGLLPLSSDAFQGLPDATFDSMPRYLELFGGGSSGLAPALKSLRSTLLEAGGAELAYEVSDA